MGWHVGNAIYSESRGKVWRYSQPEIRRDGFRSWLCHGHLLWHQINHTISLCSSFWTWHQDNPSRGPQGRGEHKVVCGLPLASGCPAAHTHSASTTALELSSAFFSSALCLFCSLSSRSLCAVVSPSYMQCQDLAGTMVLRATKRTCQRAHLRATQWCRHTQGPCVSLVMYQIAGQLPVLRVAMTVSTTPSSTVKCSGLQVCLVSLHKHRWISVISC